MLIIDEIINIKKMKIYIYFVDYTFIIVNLNLF